MIIDIQFKTTNGLYLSQIDELGRPITDIGEFT